MSTGNEWKSHYVVVMGRNYREVLFMDPEYGIVRANPGRLRRRRAL
jgi:hypothetical protein